MQRGEKVLAGLGYKQDWAEREEGEKEKKKRLFFFI